MIRFTPYSCSGRTPDRKSTRLNSSHVKISYAVVCLKKKRSLGELTNWFDPPNRAGRPHLARCVTHAAARPARPWADSSASAGTVPVAADVGTIAVDG